MSVTMYSPDPNTGTVSTPVDGKRQTVFTQL